MTIFRSSKNGQLYIISRSLRPYTGLLIVEPYNRGYNQADNKLIFLKDGYSRRKVTMKNFDKIAERMGP